MPEFSGAVKKLDDCCNDLFDICIATNWESAYSAKKFNGYKDGVF